MLQTASLMAFQFEFVSDVRHLRQWPRAINRGGFAVALESSFRPSLSPSLSPAFGQALSLDFEWCISLSGCRDRDPQCLKPTLVVIVADISSALAVISRLTTIVSGAGIAVILRPELAITSRQPVDQNSEVKSVIRLGIKLESTAKETAACSKQNTGFLIRYSGHKDYWPNSCEGRTCPLRPFRVPASISLSSVCWTPPPAGALIYQSPGTCGTVSRSCFGQLSER
jgi:hypothetical protein